MTQNNKGYKMYQNAKILHDGLRKNNKKGNILETIFKPMVHDQMDNN